MKKQLVLSVVLCVLLSAMTTSAASAQEFVPQHEVRLSAGWIPSLIGYVDYDLNYNLLEHKGATYVSGAWTLSYSCRIKKWFEVGGALSYYGYYTSTFSNFDNSKLYGYNLHYISVMPTFRFSWLNRPFVRLYSTIGLGVMVEAERWLHRSTNLYLSAQFTPVGIAVGKSLFGFAELGFGTQGMALVGIGYRFNDKNRTR